MLDDIDATMLVAQNLEISADTVYVADKEVFLIIQKNCSKGLLH
jgi:hypothetical protein